MTIANPECKYIFYNKKDFQFPKIYFYGHLTQIDCQTFIVELKNINTNFFSIKPDNTLIYQFIIPLTNYYCFTFSIIGLMSDFAFLLIKIRQSCQLKDVYGFKTTTKIYKNFYKKISFYEKYI